MNNAFVVSTLECYSLAHFCLCIYVSIMVCLWKPLSSMKYATFSNIILPFCRQISTLVVASLLMLIPVLYYVGMMFGSCGGRPGHGVQCCNKGIGANFLLGYVCFLISLQA